MSGLNVESRHVVGFVLYLQFKFAMNQCGCIACSNKGCFALWPKVERPSIFTSHIASNQEFGLSTFHPKVKVQRPSQFIMIIIF
jgi:hypothetical protein